MSYLSLLDEIDELDEDWLLDRLHVPDTGADTQYDLNDESLWTADMVGT